MARGSRLRRCMDALPVERQRRLSSVTWATWLVWLVAPGSLVWVDWLPLSDGGPIPTAGLVLLATHAVGGAVTVGLVLECSFGLLEKNRGFRPPEFWLLLGYWGAVAWLFTFRDLPFSCLVVLAWVGLATSLASALWLLWTTRWHTAGTSCSNGQ